MSDYKILESEKKKPNLLKMYYIAKGIVDFENEMKERENQQ